jgi:hypothetical protein
MYFAGSKKAFIEGKEWMMLADMPHFPSGRMAYVG